MAGWSTRAHRGLWLGVILAGASCGGDGVVESMVEPPPPAGKPFAEIQDEIFTPRCALAGCHAAPQPAEGMDLGPGQAYAHLVGVPSNQRQELLRVEPGAPDESYLILKLRGTDIVGERMPFGGPYLSTEEINGVASWILAGAPAD
jgi:hypothetical protein